MGLELTLILLFPYAWLTSQLLPTVFFFIIIKDLFIYLFYYVCFACARMHMCVHTNVCTGSQGSQKRASDLVLKDQHIS